MIKAHPAAAAVVGAVAGPAFLYGSQHGLYHLLFMPALLLEMEVGACTGSGSLLGTLDQATLVAASMAVCSANWLCPRRIVARNPFPAAATSTNQTASYAAMLASSESAATAVAVWETRRESNSGEARAARTAGRAAWINWWFGDFIEAAYPLFHRDRATYAAAVLGAAAAGAVTVAYNVKSSAYLPIPMSIALANKPAAAAAVFALQFVPPFTVELVRNARA